MHQISVITSFEAASQGGYRCFKDATDSLKVVRKKIAELPASDLADAAPPKTCRRLSGGTVYARGTMVHL